MVFLYAIGAVALVLLMLDRVEIKRFVLPWWGQIIAGTGVASGVLLVGDGPLVATPAAVFFAVGLLSVQSALVAFTRTSVRTPPRARSFPTDLR